MRERSIALKRRSAINALRANGCSEVIIRHCLSVSKNALEIASKVNIPVDRDLLEYGALLHDIGRCKSHGVEHAVIGGKIAREMGLPENVARIIERHIGAGLTASEAEKFGLPAKDLLPLTPEEKIVSYADNLTIGSRMVSFGDALERFKRVLGREHPAVQRFVSQHREIMEWMGMREKELV